MRLLRVSCPSYFIAYDTSQCILALGSFLGLVVLPTVVSLSKILAKLAIDLDKRPELIAHLTRRESIGGDDAIERVTLVESSANVVREAFKKCLSERSGGPSGLDSNGKPEGRRIGIYLTANICLKLFFHCKKVRSAEQIFGNIYQQSPPLALFPAPQRVTFLYYLGRYHFTNNHFFRAQLALQESFNQCRKTDSTQRRQILIYLIASNIILGRFPKQQIWVLPEAAQLRDKFEPICIAIKQGNINSFRQLMDIHGDHAGWFIHKRILLQLYNRCEVLIWRSLARRTFSLAGSVGDASRRAPPTLALQDLLTVAIYLEREAKDRTSIRRTRAKHTNSIFLSSKDSDQDTDQASAEDSYVDPDLAGAVEPVEQLFPTMEDIESIVASLVEQDFLHGFMAHSSHRFAITGARNAPALQVGFPKVWDVIRSKSDGEVPGWKKEEPRTQNSRAFGPGMVINLSGARPAGAAPA